ncbi:hypothetical protein WOLCODRAFT_152622 [Wolfiporia cocos MD-104 SS10]|uniref:DUF4139 domain-containing protein n=1 Tax=Wolfiporia cocos (strain MD-104) TaxID=742152 RepID=A0A2H3JL42_WOLCO|nr:hypothetical protein WOLCODRAFT_152622 [Wolfiporia cocos MD-104 SS10]
MHLSTLNASHHPTKSVSLYMTAHPYSSSMAQVARTFQIALKAGRNTVEVTHLSSHIDVDSVHVSNINGAAQVLDTQCIVKAQAQADDSESETVRQLKARKRALEDEKALRAEGQQLLINYAKSITREHETPADAVAFFDAFVDGRRASAAAIRDVEREIAGIDETIRDATVPPRSGGTGGVVTMLFSAAQDQSVEFTLKYMVSNVFWEPIYEMRAVTVDGRPAGEVTLHYNARVTQGTGEDWNETALVLLSGSASPSAQNSTIPELKPRKIRVRQVPVVPSAPPPLSSTVAQYAAQGPLPQAVQLPQARGVLSARRAPRAKKEISPPEAVDSDELLHRGRAARLAVVQDHTRLHSEASSPFPPFPPTAMPNSSAGPEFDADAEDSGDTSTVVRESAAKVRFRIDVPGPVSIPGDRTVHTLSVAVLTLRAEFKWVCVPRVRAAAFVECTATNTSSFQLLSGPVRVFVDGELVTKTQLEETHSTKNFTCSFGVDDALEITHKRTSRSSTDTAPTSHAPTRTTSCTVHTTVRNGHASAVPLVVREAHPLPSDPRVGVSLVRIGRAGAGGVDQGSAQLGRDVRWLAGADGQDGLFEWVCDVPPGQSVGLEAEWDVTSVWNVSWEEAA